MQLGCRAPTESTRSGALRHLRPLQMHATDIKQGVCPDCFCITAIGALTVYPECLRRLFLPPALSPSGVYCVQFFHRGRWVPVIIDDWVPCSPKNRHKPLFARSRTNHPWPVLIEKAYAKLYGSFEALVGGNTAEALFSLAAAPVEDFNLRGPTLQPDIASGDLWTRLSRFRREGAVMTAGTVQVCAGGGRLR